jgi:hypothetical protein
LFLRENSSDAEIKGKIDTFLTVFVGFKVVVYFEDGKAVDFFMMKFYLFFMTKILLFVHGWFILYFSWWKNCLFFIIEIVHFFMVAFLSFLSTTLCCTTWFSALNSSHLQFWVSSWNKNKIELSKKTNISYFDSWPWKQLFCLCAY